jgi:hypothetical protein
MDGGHPERRISGKQPREVECLPVWRFSDTSTGCTHSSPLFGYVSTSLSHSTEQCVIAETNVKSQLETSYSEIFCAVP